MEGDILVMPKSEENICIFNDVSLKKRCKTDKNQRNNEDFQHIGNKWYSSICSHIKPSTQIRYQSILYKYLYPKIGNIPVCEITNSYIENLCCELLMSGNRNSQPLSPKTVSDIISVLRSVIKFAGKLGIHH